MQKNRVAFVITSTGLDIHSYMTRMAICSLRLTNPNWEVVLCVDPRTEKELQQKNDLLLKEIDRLVVANVSNDHTPEYCNRFIKTHLLRWVEAPVLFLDSDILIRKSLDSLNNVTEDISLVFNNHGATLKDQIWDQDARVFEEMGWMLPDVYFNGGVIFYQNTSNARDFSEQWHHNWVSTFDKTNRYRDQPSLNYTLSNFQGSMGVLRFEYNHQFRMGGGRTEDAIIWHFFNSGESENKTSYQEELERLIKGKPLNTRRIQKLINKKNPWNQEYHNRVKILTIQAYIKNVFGRLNNYK